MRRFFLLCASFFLSGFLSLASAASIPLPEPDFPNGWTLEDEMQCAPEPNTLIRRTFHRRGEKDGTSQFVVEQITKNGILVQQTTAIEVGPDGELSSVVAMILVDDTIQTFSNPDDPSELRQFRSASAYAIGMTAEEFLSCASQR